MKSKISKFENFDFLGQYLNDRIRSETKLSLDLRFNLKYLGESSGDSGWLNVIKDYGFFVALIIFLQHIFLLSCGIRLYIAEKNVNSSIVIMIQLFLILINFIIKFYAFPFVIILSMLQLFSMLLLNVNMSLSSILMFRIFILQFYLLSVFIVIHIY